MPNHNRIYRGDIYWCKLPPRDGSIQRGDRPCVIISNDTNNKHSTVVNVIPLTLKPKKKLDCHHEFYFRGNYNIALCEQITTIKTDEVGRYLGTVSEYDLRQIINALNIQLGV